MVNHLISEKSAVVVGAGIAGIAAALRLKAKGYKVIIFDKNEKPGGKLNEFKWEGYRWDMGPSLFTLPELVDDLFNLFHKNPIDYYTYRKLDIVCRYFFSDGTLINGYNTPAKFATEVEKKVHVKKNIIFDYLQKSKVIYELTAPVFIFDTFHKLSVKRIKKALRALLQFYKLKVLSTMHHQNKLVLKEPHLVQLFDRFATYNGSNPYKAPATLNVIPYLEHVLGAYFPEKGMYSITTSLINLAIEVGVEFHLNEEVESVIHSGEKVQGVKTKLGYYNADLVVSDADIVPFYTLLNPEIKLPQRYFKGDRSTSALIFYWAIDKSFAQLELHNILFTAEYKKEFNALFVAKSFYDDPTVYIFISSKQVISDAPKGKENWFVMINTPENSGINWDDFIKSARVAIIKKINKMLKVEIEDFIQHEEILDPRLIESRTSSYKGSLYGISSNSKWSAFLRHPNYSKKIKGLFFAGGSVHPGGGIPLCLSSAKIVSDLVDEIN